MSASSSIRSLRPRTAIRRVVFFNCYFVHCGGSTKGEREQCCRSHMPHEPKDRLRPTCQGVHRIQVFEPPCPTTSQARIGRVFRSKSNSISLKEQTRILAQLQRLVRIDAKQNIKRYRQNAKIKTTLPGTRPICRHNHIHPSEQGQVLLERKCRKLESSDARTTKDPD